MRVFLAGATGTIGKRLVPQLVEAGHQVTAMTRSKEKLGGLRELGAEPVLCDVFDAGRLGTVVTRAGRRDRPAHRPSAELESAQAR